MTTAQRAPPHASSCPPPCAGDAPSSFACEAETLAGKGSYNLETTRVLHLKSNPLMDAVREKYQTEIDALKREEA